MEKQVKWIKLCVDLFDNGKIKQIRSMPDGDAVVLIWIQILCLVGRKNRNGMILLTDEIPYTEEMLATEFNEPVKTIIMALKTFEQFGMLEIIDDIYHVSNWGKYQSIDGLEKFNDDNRKRQQAYRDRQKLAAAAQSLPDAAPAEKKPALPAAPAVFQIPLNDGSFHPVTAEDIAKYRSLYPAVDISNEIRKMIGWCDANPKNRKTKSGVKRFINGWLARQQDRGHAAAPMTAVATPVPQPQHRMEDWDNP